MRFSHQYGKPNDAVLASFSIFLNRHGKILQSVCWRWPRTITIKNPGIIFNIKQKGSLKTAES